MRFILTLAGLVITVALFIGIHLFYHELEHTGYQRGLLELTAIGGVILASALFAEAFQVTPAMFEILLGYFIGVMGVTSGEFIETLALIGGVLLMFMAGLEVDITLLRSVFIRSLIIGSVSFAAPMIATFGVLYILGYSITESLLASVGVSTTSVAVVYMIIRKTGLITIRKGQLILASTMVADIVSILAYTAVVFKPSSILLIYVASLIIVPWLTARYIRKLPRIAFEAETRLILALVLVVTLFSEIAGIHGILFSFLLGVAFSTSPDKEDITQKTSTITFGFLAPIFFTSAGLLISKAGISGVLVPSIILLATSYPVKVLASYGGMRLLTPLRDLKLANVFGARLTVSTIIAYSGLKTGLLSPALAAGVMFTALIATILSSVVTGGKVEERV
ncbi:MAG: cation:proton antiporter [Desulfurococcales archaeon]|nr:cation:proton antiporter [Desulfurococcales archaeon]